VLYTTTRHDLEFARARASSHLDALETMERRRACFDRLSMRENFTPIGADAIKKCPHPEPVEGRMAPMQFSVQRHCANPVHTFSDTR
jgi:hypothetical protein